MLSVGAFLYIDTSRISWGSKRRNTKVIDLILHECPQEKAVCYKYSRLTLNQHGNVC